MGVECNGDSLR